MYPKNYYIADWHYNHANSIAYDNRPFQTLEEMNAALVQRWNDTVEDRDTVYVLGDMFCRCNAKEAVRVLRGLRGKKVLIRGNHDYLTRDSEFRTEFIDIRDYLELEDGWRYVVLCHYPIPCFHHHFHEEYCHLYGHVHNSFEWNMIERFRTAMEEEGHYCEMCNAGAMMPWMDYTPRTLKEITLNADIFRMNNQRQPAPKKEDERPPGPELKAAGKKALLPGPEPKATGGTMKMNCHLRTGDGKRYQDSKTGQNYRFDWRQFYRAFQKAVRDAGNGQGGVNEVEVRLVKAARDAGDSYEEMSEGEALMVKAAQEYGRQEKSHLYYFSSLERWRHKSPLAGKHPKDISVIRSYGAVLTGNEEAFLLPWTAAARPSISLDELRRWHQWEQRGFELGFSHNSDAQRIIQDVFAALWDILSLYEISDGYNYRPDTGAQEGAEEYFDTLLKDALKKCDVERRSVEESLVVESLDPHLSDRLKDIVYQTEAFVKTHSLWIADLRWPESNPRLNYYDPVFELLEELPLDDFERLRNNFFYDHPTQRDIHLRRLYFSALEEQDSGGDMAYFQAELLDTLVKIFKKEF